MPEVYGASSTYLNEIMTLTASQFGDKVDIFYTNLSERPEILAVNMFTVENEELALHVAFEVPDDVDPQNFTNEVIGQIIKDEFHAATLRMRPKVAERVAEFV